MGIYLSTPKTEKFSEDGENDSLSFGLSSMQGWRATMEDAVSTHYNLILFLCIFSFPAACVYLLTGKKNWLAFLSHLWPQYTHMYLCICTFFVIKSSFLNIVLRT